MLFTTSKSIQKMLPGFSEVCPERHDGFGDVDVSRRGCRYTVHVRQRYTKHVSQLVRVVATLKTEKRKVFVVASLLERALN